MKEVFITGATGVMGKASLDAILERGDCKVRLLVRKSKKNRKLMKPYLRSNAVTVIWGDLTDKNVIKEALGNALVVLHIGGLVSPAADRYPEQTMKVNVEGTRNVVEAIKQHPEADRIRLVYIGSVAQISLHSVPHHWGRTGDPVVSAEFDHYGLSKIKAERIVAESGLKYWVSLRQSGILHPGLFLRGSNPITFHVPLQGVLEWTTVEDSGLLMKALCGDQVPEQFWRNFYNIGSGSQYRLTNYEFETLILEAVGSPRPEKIFETNWFATRNFHGCWFADSDRLEQIVPFRRGISLEKYMKGMVKKAPWWTRLACLAPPAVVKRMMRKVALTDGEGTLDWIRRHDCEDKIKAFFGSREERECIPGWTDIDLSRPSEKPLLLHHGYDDTKADDALGIEDCRSAAAFRGGSCLSEGMEKGNLDAPLRWQCARGHSFEATPRTILRGGHWCPDCLDIPWKSESESSLNPFLSQLFS